MTLQLSDGGVQGRGPSGRVFVTPSRPVIGCIKGHVFSKKVLLLEDKYTHTHCGLNLFKFCEDIIVALFMLLY